VRYHIVTLGCPKNVVDSERIERVLDEGRHRAVTRPSQADLLIVNTCGFIDAATEESLDAILALASRKQRGQRLLVAGCLSQLHADELLRDLPEVDVAFGVEAWDDIAAYAAGLDGEIAGAAFDIPETPASAPRPSAYLKIADGCDAPCTFCIIPAIKGPARSAPADQLVAEARRLAAQGVQELVLVAQDSTEYGRDLGQRDGLPQLLECLAQAVPEVPWLRVMYAYPGHVSKALARTMASLPQVCHYLDIPLQHGSPSVLRRMRRPSSLRRVREMIETLRTAMPDIALRSTFIVGYPGETEEEFEELLALVRELRFDHVGAFTFSPQAGTSAARQRNQVPERVKRRRYRRLMETAQEVSHQRNREWLGHDLDVLVESKPSRSRLPANETFFVGRSFRDAPEVDGLVLCSGRAEPGTWRRVRITQALPYDLVGLPADT
jgi:ribosomal protein S12 methylthiotransferase